MPYSDPEVQREFQRNWQRSRRSGAANCRTLNLTGPEKIKTAADVLRVLEIVTNDVLDTDVDPLVRARCVAYCCSVTLKAVEAVDLEQRLEAVEAALNLRKEKMK